MAKKEESKKPVGHHGKVSGGTGTGDNSMAGKKMSGGGPTGVHGKMTNK